VVADPSDKGSTRLILGLTLCVDQPVDEVIILIIQQAVERGQLTRVELAALLFEKAYE
jgi:hypothetical protein